MKFLADMGVAKRIVDWLRENGHDVAHLREEGVHGLTNGSHKRLTPSVPLSRKRKRGKKGNK